jgi:putative toxin-antitoxin system antitoxin component (TIGR02293 family)
MPSAIAVDISPFRTWYNYPIDTVISPKEKTMLESRIAKLLGGETMLKRPIRSELDFADAITVGIPVESVKRLQSYLNANDTRMAKLIHVSPKTYRSRKLFKGDEGDHAYTIARIVVAAEEAIGSREAALQWLQSEQTALGGRVPMDLIATSAGMQAVEDLLGRIEYGVYS